jgi:hypothetical protein
MRGPSVAEQRYQAVTEYDVPITDAAAKSGVSHLAWIGDEATVRGRRTTTAGRGSAARRPGATRDSRAGWRTGRTSPPGAQRRGDRTARGVRCVTSRARIAPVQGIAQPSSAYVRSSPLRVAWPTMPCRPARGSSAGPLRPAGSTPARLPVPPGAAGPASSRPQPHTRCTSAARRSRAAPSSGRSTGTGSAPATSTVSGNT